MRGTITADGTVGPFTIGKGPVHISFSGTFNSASIAIEQKTEQGATALLDNGSAITITAADDSLYNLQPGDTVQFTTSGSSSPSVQYSITGV